MVIALSGMPIWFEGRATSAVSLFRAGYCPMRSPPLEGVHTDALA